MLRVYPRNGRQIHDLNDFEYKRVKPPTKRMIKTIDQIRLIPTKIINYFREAADQQGEVYLLSQSDLPNVNNRVTFYSSRIDDLMSMLNALHRNIKHSSKSDIDELIRVSKDMYRNVGEMVSFFRNKSLHRQPILRDSLNRMISKTGIFNNRLKQIIESRGIRY